MTRLPIFRSASEIAAERNLDAFIQRSRQNLAGAGFAWDDSAWPGVRWVKLSVGTRAHSRDDELLDPEFVDFAKAYSVSKNAARPSSVRWERQALRCIESALVTRTRSGSIQGLSRAVLDDAVTVASGRFSPQVRYHVGREIQLIAEFVSNQRLIPRDLSTWKHSCKRPSSTRRTGAAGRDEAASKLPSEAGLHAMAEVFANDPQDPPVRFASAIFALLMCAPWRISEVLTLHVDAEYEVADDQGVPSYGLRFYGAKGFGHDIKWVPQVMEPVAREAFRRLREMTESARTLARHLETTPGIPFLYFDAPEVGVEDALSLDQKSAYLRRPLPKRVQRNHPTWGFQSIREHWDQARIRVPRGFPVFDIETGLKWSQALCCVPRNLLHRSRPVDWYAFAAPNGNTINDLFGSGRWKTGVLARLGYREPDGRPIRLRSHQPRHYLSTVAERGAMAQSDMAKWAGRALMRDNRVYNHVPQSERVQRIRHVLADTPLGGSSTPSSVPVPTTPAQFNWGACGPTHRTEFGICEHDWAMAPCLKNRDCLNCCEHVYRKGDAEVQARIRAMYDHHVAECTKALDAVRVGTAVADRWLEHALRSLGRERQLLELLESDAIEDGAPVRLSDAHAEHSHLRRALDQLLREPSLPESICDLIASYLSGESPDTEAD